MILPAEQAGGLDVAITERRMTLEEFLKLPEIDEKPYLELVDGVVRRKQSMAPQWLQGEWLVLP
jgi:hypothetical protein